jgi:hypothetical protein
MYGVKNIDTFVEQIKDSFSYRAGGAAMVVASMMSDAQEEMDYGLNGAARKTLNRAKHLMFLAMDGGLEMWTTDRVA